MTTLTFDQSGTFKALAQAEQWCKENGYSYGSLQRDANVGILKGDWCISKWRNLSAKERAELDGYMHSNNFREGPVFIFLKDVAEV